MIQRGIRYEVGISGTYGLASKIQVCDLHQHNTTCAKYCPQTGVGRGEVSSENTRKMLEKGNKLALEG